MKHGAAGIPILGILTIITLGLALRLEQLDEPSLWVDEAESSLNALTILEVGTPRATYSGMPIFENTLLQPWPGHPEFEFRDLSYSEDGFAIYHGWLPLYAIAASFRLFGIEPEPLAREGTPRFDREARRTRTLAARAPAISFSLAFLLVLAAAAHELFGRQALLPTVTLGAFWNALVWMGRQARYYSPTLFLVALGILCTARFARRGTISNALALGATWGLLFHTHLLSAAIFATASGAWFLLQPPLLLRRLRLLAIGAVPALAFTLPWLFLTGFLEQRASIPRAWSFLRLEDATSYLEDRWKPVACALVIAIVLSWLAWRSPRVRERLRALRASGALLGLWALSSLLWFVGGMPAASFFPGRLSLCLFVPALLLLGGAIGELSRAWTSRFGASISILAAGAFLWLGNRVERPELPRNDDVTDVVLLLEQEPIPARAKVYATPNDHLVLTFYTGLEIQSIAPVRKTFLENHPGPLILIERSDVWIEPGESAHWPERSAALKEFSLGEREEDVARLEEEVVRGLLVDRLVARGLRSETSVTRGLAIEACRGRQRVFLAERARRFAGDTANLPVFRGYEIRTARDWWETFFYRFVDPERRSGERSNTSVAFAGAGASVSPRGGWILHRSDGSVGESSERCAR